MDERLFARLAARVAHGPVVLASVMRTRGAVPRRSGARMLVTADATEFSVGGGLAEARVVEAGRALLRSEAEDAPTGSTAVAHVEIELTGRAGSAGVCGGTMSIALRRWSGAGDAARAAAIASQLARGEPSTLAPEEHGGDEPALLRPNERLLIVGGGHCALALHELARHLEYDTWVQDERDACFERGAFEGATCLAGGVERLREALDTGRRVVAVLLNREYAADVAALAVLAEREPATVLMMGSRKRVAAVADALPAHRALLERIHAPAGLEIGAETPHEIAVSILAQLVGLRGA